MNTALFGGTFDPFHNGHQHVVDALLTIPTIDQVMLIPNRLPPHKNEPHTLPHHRLSMLKCLHQQNPRLTISEFEINREGLSYTWITIQHLIETQGDNRFFLTLGSDSYFNFHRWKNWKQLMEQVMLIVIDREPTGHEKKMRYLKMTLQVPQDRVQFLSVEPVEVSSTTIRALIKAQEPIQSLVPRVIAEYIEKEHLYHS